MCVHLRRERGMRDKGVGEEERRGGGTGRSEGERKGTGDSRWE